MIKLLKYIFCRLFLFYKDVLKASSKIHYNVSFVVALLLFGNIFLIINTFNTVVFGQSHFRELFIYYILIGNVLVFSMIAFASIKQMYKKWLEEFERLAKPEKTKLNIISVIYGAISLLSVAFFMIRSYNL